MRMDTFYMSDLQKQQRMLGKRLPVASSKSS